MTIPITTTNEVQHDVDFLRERLQDRQPFETHRLRSLYMSLLLGLQETEAMDLKRMMEASMATIDTNNDGMIDALEMEHLHLPRETEEFLFDDVVDCTTTATNEPQQQQQQDEEEDCVTAANVVDFLNLFYGGTKLVRDDLALLIAQAGGTDACLTRWGFEQAFGVAEPSVAAGVRVVDASLCDGGAVPLVAVLTMLVSLVVIVLLVGLPLFILHYYSQSEHLSGWKRCFLSKECRKNDTRRLSYRQHLPYVGFCTYATTAPVRLRANAVWSVDTLIQSHSRARKKSFSYIATETFLLRIQMLRAESCTRSKHCYAGFLSGLPLLIKSQTRQVRNHSANMCTFESLSVVLFFLLLSLPSSNGL